MISAKESHIRYKEISARYLEGRRVPSSRRFQHYACMSSQVVYRGWFTPQSNGEYSKSARACKSCLSTDFVRIIALDPRVSYRLQDLQTTPRHRSHQHGTLREKYSITGEKKINNLKLVAIIAKVRQKRLTFVPRTIVLHLIISS